MPEEQTQDQDEETFLRRIIDLQEQGEQATELISGTTRPSPAITAQESQIIRQVYHRFSSDAFFQDGISTSHPHCIDCGLNCEAENAQDFIWGNNELWCDSCYEQAHFECQECGVMERKNNVCRWGCDAEYRYCHNCENGEHYTCNNCGNLFDIDEDDWQDGDGRYCRRCVENGSGSGSIGYRDYADKSDFLAPVVGKTLTSLRPVGIELEVEYGSKKNVIQAIKKMPRCIGIGSDASINGAGIELRFPPAVGKQLEEMVVQTCTALKDNSIGVNPSCGYHVHIDMADFGEMESEKQLKAIKTLWILYLAFEDVLVSFLPPSRHSNKYCKTIRAEYSIGEVLNCRNRDDLERMWYRVRTAAQLHECKTDQRHSYSDDQTRYRGINFHPFWKEGHMEVRYHTGTINPVKILEWANLHAKIVDAATNIRLDKAMIDHLKSACNSFDMEEKTNILFNIVRLSKDSEGYYLARQDKFKRADRKIKETAAFKSGMAILEAEKEI